ncbi:ParB N-terminal domain-containing protein [Oceaniglobus roseus]|uniref:ParB N-terminal domain-containing protein n=1 Tax=Oceaniglobus roseus TaxID=1737570 RepID=UPI000C7E8615|nr:ParB N-terminal domain-containing protein [Kandeliimicrobium roseum]
MSKRRVFDIDFPSGPEESAAPASEARRSPMAAAITENASALGERQSAEAAIRAENDALAHEHVRLKKLGLITDLIPLSEIEATKLVRDRWLRDDPELAELKASIKAVGLSNPIRVEKTESGYQLVQGFRRLAAYMELDAEHPDGSFARIPAGLIAPGETLEGLYRRMVDENLVRKDISFAEMGLLAIGYFDERAEDLESPMEAVESLYRSASRQKRGHIRVFVQLMMALGDDLDHPEAIPRSLGSDLMRRIDEDPEVLDRVTEALKMHPLRTAEQELEILRHAATAPKPRLKPVKGLRPSTAKTTLRLSRPEGLARCTVADGKVELRQDRDFAAIDRPRLERAMAAFFAALDDRADG